MNAIDTNVVAYSVDADAKDKRPKALALLAALDPADTVTVSPGRSPASSGRS